MLNKINKMIAIFVFICLSMILYSQEVIINKGLSLQNKFIDSNPILKNVEKIDERFNDYFVIELNNLELDTFRSTCFAKAFWITDLDEINNPQEYYWYFTNYFLWLPSYYYNEELRDFVKGFVLTYTTINYESRGKYHTYLYSAKDWVLTDALDSVNTWSKYNRDYIIFETSFTAAIVTAENSRNPNNKEKPFLIKTFVPLSSLDYFSQIDDEKARNSGFEPSKIKIILK